MDPIEAGGTPGQSPLPAQNSGVWPPPPTIPVQEERINNSGMKGEVPPEIARLKWNWGAFFLPFLWSITHNLKWGWSILAITIVSRAHNHIGSLFSVMYIAVSIYLGLKGHTLAWQNRRFDGGMEQYFAVQRKWLGWGIAVFLFTLIAWIEPYAAQIYMHHILSQYHMM